MIRGVMALGVVLAIAGGANAQGLDRSPDEPANLPPPTQPQQPALVTPPREAPLPPPEPNYFASLTVSPFHLGLPILEVSGEFDVTPNVSVTGIFGGGRVSDAGLTATVTEFGVQASYYFMKRFRGLHAGVEALWVRVTDIDIDSSALGAGFAIGPFGGWKWIHSSGFTFNGQIGLDFTVVRASSSSSSAEERSVFPLLNLQVGWTF